jgi:hypothetical protein
MNYYRDVRTLARRRAWWARSVIDVGSHNCHYVNDLGWIPYRERIDLHPQEELPGAVTKQADFLQYEPGRVFDLVLCLQVIEHLEDPAAFCRKLMATGKLVILSVPYKWPRKSYIGHLHDPIDKAKLRRWLDRPWLRERIVQDGQKATSRRLVVMLAGDHCPAWLRVYLNYKAGQPTGIQDYVRQFLDIDRFRTVKGGVKAQQPSAMSRANSSMR